MNGTTRLFWKRFVEQARHLLEVISLTNIELFNDGADIIARIKGLYTHLTADEEAGNKYKQFLEPAYIADLFYENDKAPNFKEVIRLLPSHIYQLLGRGSMTKALVRDVGVLNHMGPKNPAAELMDVIAAKAGEGTSRPHLVGLPSLVAVVVRASEAQSAKKGGLQGAAPVTSAGTPTGVAKTTQKRSAPETRWPPRSKPLKNVTIEGGRPASPP
ncbi:unnamed protein product [Calypogeia fissa]